MKMRNANLEAIENFLCRYFEDWIVINDRAYKLMDFDENEEGIRLILKTDEYKDKEYFIIIKDIIKMQDDIFKLHIQQKNNKTLIIEEY